VYKEEENSNKPACSHRSQMNCTKTIQDVGQQRRQKGTNGGTGKKDDGEYQCK
jgi:hypothetical protein